MIMFLQTLTVGALTMGALTMAPTMAMAAPVPVGTVMVRHYTSTVAPRVTHPTPTTWKVTVKVTRVRTYTSVRPVKVTRKGTGWVATVTTIKK